MPAPVSPAVRSGANKSKEQTDAKQAQQAAKAAAANQELKQHDTHSQSLTEVREMGNHSDNPPDGAAGGGVTGLPYAGIVDIERRPNRVRLGKGCLGAGMKMRQG